MQSKELSQSSPTPQFKSINSSVLSFLYSSTLTSIHDHWKNHSFANKRCFIRNSTLSFSTVNKATNQILLVKNPPTNEREVGSVSGLGRSPGEGNGNSLLYPCLGNSMDRGAWRATVHGVAKDSHAQFSDQTITTKKPLKQLHYLRLNLKEQRNYSVPPILPGYAVFLKNTIKWKL